MSEFGRIDDDGTVYVTTADGERAVGSWQAGTPEEGLAHFARRYEVLSTEVALLEQRLRSGAGDPQQVAQSASRLKGTIPTAAAVGDLAALERRVDGLLEKTADAVEAGKAAKAEARARAAEAKAALAEEAERLAGTSGVEGQRRAPAHDRRRLEAPAPPRPQGRGRALAAHRRRPQALHRAADDPLRGPRAAAHRLAGAQGEAHQGGEALSASTEWGPTAGRYKTLMTEWKTAGRAPREVEDVLWDRFKAAQDAFFAARNAHFSVQDEELRGNQKVKEEILAEAETIDPSQGLDKAKARLRTLQDRWEAAGKVPRDVMRSLEDRMGAVETKIRTAGEARFARSDESPFTAKLREKVVELEVKLEKARAAGRPTDELEAALTTQRQWLAQAGGGSSAPAGAAPASAPAPARKKSTSGWVRAE
jgi:hypothetical protein